MNESKPGVTEQRSGTRRKYFSLDVDMGLSSAPWLKWVNQTEMLKGFSTDRTRTLPFKGLNISEPPQIAFDRHGKRGALIDIYPNTLGLWFVSDRAKSLLENLDHQAFAFSKTRTDYSNLPVTGLDYWLCDIVRVLDCIDEGQSLIRLQEDVPFKHYLHLLDVRMRSDVVGSAHAFRLVSGYHIQVVDDVIASAFEAEKITGLRFAPIQKS